MPLHESDSIILKTYPLGEADRIVVFLSRDQGKLRGVAKGARRLKNRFGAALEPLTHCRITFFEKETRDLVLVQSSELLDSPLKLFQDYERAVLAAHMVDLVDRFLPEHEPHDEVFRLMRMTVRALEQGCPIDFATCYFEVWMLRLSGVFPDLFICSACGRKLNSEENRFLMPGLQATVCGDCQEQGTVAIESDTIRALRWILRKPLEGAGPAGPAGPDGPAVGLGDLQELNRYWIQQYLQR